MPIIQHLGTAISSGGIDPEAAQPFGDGSCRSYYPFNNNGNVPPGDDINSGYNFDNWSSRSWSTGKQGTHCWNGTGSNWMQVTGQSVANVTNYTMNFWYKSNNTSQGNKRLVTIRAQSYTSGWSNYAGSLGFYVGNSSGYTTSVTRQRQLPDGWVNDNQWHMLTSTMTSGKSWEIYLDGSQTNGSSNQGDGRSFNDGSFLALTCYNATAGYNTIGQVDNLRIFNRVLSATEIADLYTWENV